MHNLNLDHLRTFANVAEVGTFSGAAERLHITQPAVSQQIRQLERLFGVALFERVGKRATLTLPGRDLLAHVHRIEAATREAVEAMACYKSGETTGCVRLGTGAAVCTYVLPPILRDLKKRFPRLDMVVTTGNTSDILKALEQNCVDVALVTLPAPGRAFDVTPVMDDELVAIFQSRCPDPPAVVSAATLAKLPVVADEPDGNTRHAVDQWFSRAGLRFEPVMEMGNVEAIKELVGAGLGCGVLPRMSLSGQGCRGRFVIRSLSPPLRRKLAIVLRRDKRLDRGLRAVVNALKGLQE